MTLITKIPQAELPLDALYSVPDGESEPEKSVFSGLFSLMMDAQDGVESGSLRQVEQLGFHEVALNSESLPGITTPYDASIDGVVKDVVTQLASLNSSDLMGDAAEQLPLAFNSVFNSVLGAESGGDGAASFSEKWPFIALGGDAEGEILDSLESGIFSPSVAPTSVAFGAESLALENTGLNQSVNSSNQRFDLASSNANLTMNEVIEGEGIEWGMAQQRLVMQGDASVQAEGVPVNALNQNSRSALNQGVTSWGGQSLEGQSSQGVGQQSPTSGQSFQQGSGQTAQQQALLFAQQASQINQESKQRSLEQQVAVKAMDDAIAKPESREWLGGAEIASLMTSDRKGMLPLGLQSINLPVKHPQWGQALGQRVLFMSHNGLQQAQITLNPQSLGQIQVTLQLDKDQKMHVNLVAQNGVTRESMENALPRLREMMEQAGVSLASVDIRDQKSFSEHASNSPDEGGASSDSNSLLEAPSFDDEPSERILSTDNIVDYYA